MGFNPDKLLIMSEKKTVKKRLSAVQRRDQIVRTAADLFARKGFNGTTTREIAERAGISEAVIYRHFACKDDLYDAIIKARCMDGSGELRLMALLKGKKGREVFHAVASFLISEHAKDDTFLRLMTYSALEGNGLSERFMHTRGLEFYDYLQKQIESLVDSGVFRKADSAIAAKAFMGMVVYYGISQEIFGFKKYFKRTTVEVVDSFVDIFFDGMLKT